MGQNEKAVDAEFTEERPPGADRVVTDVSDFGRNLPTVRGSVDVEKMVRDFDHEITLYRKLVAASIAATRPQDWVIMGDRAYLQGTGADSVARVWGIMFGAATITREVHPDLPGPDGKATYTYICAGPIGCKKTGMVFENLEGTRWSGDKFFWGKRIDQSTGEEIMIPPDPSDVRKAAFENWKGRGVGMIAGLRNVTPEDLALAGMTKVGKVEFQKGAQGGTVAPGRKATAWRTPKNFGPAEARDKAINDPSVTLSHLEWYLDQANKKLKDPTKKEWWEKEKAWKAHLEAELDARFAGTGDQGDGEPREPGSDG